jgi:TonB family protein
MAVRSVKWLGLALVVLVVPAAGAQTPQAPSPNIAALRQAAEAGDPRAQYQLGLSYRDGRGVAVDLPMAYFWISLAAPFAETSADQATYYDALDALTARMTPAQKSEGDRRGFDEIGRLATAGRAWAQAFLGAALHGGTTVDGTKDVVLGIQWLQKAAAQGDTRAQFKLGLIHYNGEGVPADLSRAMEFFRAAALQGHAMAQAALANGYYRGVGVLQDYAQAAQWWRRAAEAGVVEAQINLGDAYRLGKGVAQDYAEAARWYRKGAEQGSALAQSNLGVAYQRGEGMPVDGAEAYKWYRRSAEQGFATGQFNLGYILADGKVVAQDYVEAHKWMNLAAARATGADQKEFAGARDQLAQSMTPAQIAEAQKRAREWLEAFDSPVGKVVGGLPAAPPPPPPPPPPAAPPPSSAPNAPVRVGGAIKEPVKTKHVEAVYPPIAISARIQGVVFVEAVIGPDGRITSATVIRSASVLLERAAVDAVTQWEYTPTILNGVPVSVVMTVTVNFTIR